MEYENVDKNLQYCFKLIDENKDALSKGKIVQSKKCQELLKEYKEKISSPEVLKEIINYKRKKFGELAQIREQTDLGQTQTEIEKKLKAEIELYKMKIAEMYKTEKEYVQGRENYKKIISELNKSKEEPKVTIDLGERN